MTDAKPWHGVDHYENFPVGSRLVPTRIRPAVVAIYQFARHADDIADEGDICVMERDHALRLLDDALTRAERGEPAGDRVVENLIEHISRHGLHWHYFHALIDAFRQDLRVRRYASPRDVQDYCRRSANPVGRLMLQLFDADTGQNREAADAICSALQRINFLQDIGIDAHKERIYVPLTTLARAGISAQRFLDEAMAGRLSVPARRAVRHEWKRAHRQMRAGMELPRHLPWRMGMELRFIIAGGLRILDRIARANYDAVARRPTLGWMDGPALLRRALWLPRHQARQSRQP